jgi:hypothetical protein
MRLLAGREFSQSDGNGAPKVAVVNEAFLKKFNLGLDAVGRHIGMKADNKLDRHLAQCEIQPGEAGNAADIFPALPTGGRGVSVVLRAHID